MNPSNAYGMMRSLAIYYGQVWRRGRLEAFYRQFLAPGSLAFDIGSHVGNRTRAFRNLGARVVAVEPQPDFFRLLNLLYGRDSEVTLQSCGIGSQAGQGTLWVSSATPTVSSCTQQWVDDAKSATRFENVRWDQNVSIELRTLQDLIDQYGRPNFCKIDIEGGEEDALAGLHTPLAALSFECIAAMSTQAQRCVDRLMELGPYEFRYSKLETMRWSSDRWLSAAEVRTFLSTMPANSPAGDVYARLRVAP